MATEATMYLVDSQWTGAVGSDFDPSEPAADGDCTDRWPMLLMRWDGWPESAWWHISQCVDLRDGAAADLITPGELATNLVRTGGFRILSPMDGHDLSYSYVYDLRTDTLFVDDSDRGWVPHDTWLIDNPDYAHGPYEPA